MVAPVAAPSQPERAGIRAGGGPAGAGDLTGLAEGGADVADQDVQRGATSSKRYVHQEMLVSTTPRGRLGELVDAIWLYHAPASGGGRERRLPTGRAELVLNLREDRFSLYDEPHKRGASGGDRGRSVRTALCPGRRTAGPRPRRGVQAGRRAAAARGAAARARRPPRRAGRRVGRRGRRAARARARGDRPARVPRGGRARALAPAGRRGRGHASPGRRGGRLDRTRACSLPGSRSSATGSAGRRAVSSRSSAPRWD